MGQIIAFPVHRCRAPEGRSEVSSPEVQGGLAGLLVDHVGSWCPPFAPLTALGRLAWDMPVLGMHLDNIY